MAPGLEPPEPEGSHHRRTDEPTDQILASTPANLSSLSRRASGRHDPRQEPGAVTPLAGIRAGGGGQPPSLPRQQSIAICLLCSLRCLLFNLLAASPRRPRRSAKGQAARLTRLTHQIAAGSEAELPAASAVEPPVASAVEPHSGH